MLTTSLQKLPPAKGDQNVLVKVSEVDRGRLVLKNVLAVALNAKSLVYIN